MTPSRTAAAPQLLLPLHVHKPKNKCFHRYFHRLTCQQYDLMLWRAAGHCEICGIDQAETGRGSLVVDHDSGLGNSEDHIRGMLCDRCNIRFRFVDNGYRLPTEAELRYIDNAWFWEWLPPDRIDEPYFPQLRGSPTSSPRHDQTPAYRRRCLAGHVDQEWMRRYPPSPAPLRVSYKRFAA